MKPLPHSFKVLFQLIVGASLLLALLLLGVLALNWRDEPLSEPAYQALYPSPPTEAQLQDNGHLIVLGMDAPVVEGQDTVAIVAAAHELGRQRLTCTLAQRARFSADPSQTLQQIQQHEEQASCHARRDALAPAVLPSALRCPHDAREYFTWHAEHREALHAHLLAHQPLLKRLAAVGQARQFEPFL